MAKFTRSDDFWRWLDTRPEKHRRAEAIALAARAALRVLPLVSADWGEHPIAPTNLPSPVPPAAPLPPAPSLVPMLPRRLAPSVRLPVAA